MRFSLHPRLLKSWMLGVEHWNLREINVKWALPNRKQLSRALKCPQWLFKQCFQGKREARKKIAKQFINSDSKNRINRIYSIKLYMKHSPKWLFILKKNKFFTIDNLQFTMLWEFWSWQKSNVTPQRIELLFTCNRAYVEHGLNRSAQ